jgi:hypothetical protein
VLRYIVSEKGKKDGAGKAGGIKFPVGGASSPDIAESIVKTPVSAPHINKKGKPSK